LLLIVKINPFITVLAYTGPFDLSVSNNCLIFHPEHAAKFRFDLIQNCGTYQFFPYSFDISQSAAIIAILISPFMTTTNSYGSVEPQDSRQAVSPSFEHDEEKQTESYETLPILHEEIHDNSIGKRKWSSIVAVLILATVVALLGVAGYRNYGDLASSAKLEGSLQCLCREPRRGCSDH
jgi:hypothetical protein